MRSLRLQCREGQPSGGGGVIADVAASGIHLNTLRALRDRIASDIDTCESARDVAALSQRLMDLLKQIAELEAAEAPAATEGSGLLDLTKRLADRKSATTTARKGSG